MQYPLMIEFLPGALDEFFKICEQIRKQCAFGEDTDRASSTLECNQPHVHVTNRKGGTYGEAWVAANAESISTRCT